MLKTNRVHVIAEYDLSTARIALFGVITLFRTHVLAGQGSPRNPQRAMELHYWEAYFDGLSRMGRLLVAIGVLWIRFDRTEWKHFPFDVPEQTESEPTTADHD